MASVAFAYAATMQHAAVDQSVNDGRRGRLLGPRRILAVVRTRQWQLGIGLGGVGSALHVAGLALAPIIIVQPVGVLAVPIAVLISARHRGRRPSAAVVSAVSLTIAAIAVFVVVATLGQNSAEDIDLVHIGWTGVVTVVVLLLLVAASSRAHGWVTCLACAMAGASLYGFAAALVRTMMVLIGHGRGFDPPLYAVVAGALVCFGLGGWLVQQALASGPPEVVLGCLTVLDPIVAAVFGLVFLGEGDRTGPIAATTMVVAGLVAALGVVLLARHHPEARHVRTDDDSAPVEADHERQEGTPS